MDDAGKRNRIPEGELPSGATAWISRGFEALLHKLARQEQRPALDYDVIIVGSGYGGAVAAAELAGCTIDNGHGSRRPVTLCVLERGREYLPGSFPSKFSEMPGHVRVSAPGRTELLGPRDGLFDVRAGMDVSAVVANGLGGGSLINAGVMIAPEPQVFDTRWPQALRDDTALSDYYEQARRMLGATDAAGFNTIERRGERLPLKYQTLRRMAARGQVGHAFSAAHLTVAMRAEANHAGVLTDACTGCGDCATGCNHGAKISLDTNLLVTAHQRGAELYTGASALRVERIPGEGETWSVAVVHTDDTLRRRQGSPLLLKARRVILAAGAFGSTEILMRSRGPDLQLSQKLGQQFSTNGDMIATGYGHEDPVHAVADEDQPSQDREIGPTITGMIDLRREAGLLIQELAVPGPLRRIFEEAIATSYAFESLTRPAGTGSPDLCAIDRKAIARTGVYAVMGDDGAAGTLELPDANHDVEGGLRVRWPAARKLKLFTDQIDALKRLADDAEVLPHPLWQMLPSAMEETLKVEKGPLLTVHPLGGCPMGDSCETGVVNDCGRVYDWSTRQPFEGLVVLDGAIVPRALGANPALTIAALSLRAVGALRRQWRMQAGDASPATAAIRRPVFRLIPLPVPAERTKVQILERMVGKVILRGADGALLPRVVELTLRFAPIAVADLTASGGAELQVESETAEPGATSRIRIFEPDKWEVLVNGRVAAALQYEPDWRDPSTPQKLGQELVSEEVLEREAEFSAPLAGSMSAFVPEEDASLPSTFEVFRAWMWNRGLRDAYQAGVDQVLALFRGGSLLNDERPLPDRLRRPAHLLREAWTLATHARRARQLKYRLTIGTPSKESAQAPYAAYFQVNTALSGYKRLVYARRANPWRQLSEMTLDAFPGMHGASLPVLKLDTRFLANQQWPLLRIVGQQDQPAALAEMASLATYLARMLATIHLWSFRMPDALPLRTPERLPGRVPGLPEPETHEIEVDRTPEGEPVHVRTTRYRRQGSALPPIVMIHGYSTSGTTFAHPGVHPNMARYFWNKGRDVWILDLRTSSGMPTAQQPWTFEQIAYADIPAAFDYIFRTVNAEVGAEVGAEAGAPERKIDVFAHCMGSAMFSMAVLKASSPDETGRFVKERQQLPSRINKLVMSQVGPAVILSADNILRGYLMHYVRALLPLLKYEFHPSGKRTWADDLLDRLLASLPYPEEEFDLENPSGWKLFRRTGFTGIRHRLDALYGRDFRLANMSRRTLQYMDDLFGPLNLETISQVIHFSRFQTVTTRTGINEFVHRKNIVQRWRFPSLSVHGVENGLFDIATLDRMQRLFDRPEYPFRAIPIAGYGHQDCLIGKNADRDVFEPINAFLNEPETATPLPSVRSNGVTVGEWGEWAVAVPWIGPLVAREHDGRLSIAVGPIAHPVLGQAVLFALVSRSGTGVGELRVHIDLVGSVADGEWMRLSIDPAAWTSGDELLVLLLYPESEHLLQVEWGDPFLGLGTEDLANAEAAVRRYVSTMPAQHLEKSRIDPRAFRVPRDDSRTLPSVASTVDNGITFALASCQYPAGMLDRIPAYASYRRLDALLAQPDSAGKPAFLLLVGDQIYSDATAGLFDPVAIDDRYRVPYEQLMRNPAVRSVFRRIPVYAMLDDHEIEDNWECPPSDRSGNDDRESIKRLNEGRQAYWRYQRSAGPGKEPARGDSTEPLWYAFEEHGFPFFVLDTRTERGHRNAGSVEKAHIMSTAQFERLTEWLDIHGELDVPKFIASPSIVLPRLRKSHQSGNPAAALHSDAWDGYPASLHALLAYIADNGIRNVVFLSGDEHISCHTSATVTDPNGVSVDILSIHSSALYAPYPFANAIPDDLAGDEVFCFSQESGDQGAVEEQPPSGYRCAVRTSYAPKGDGFALVHVRKNEGKWEITCEWSRETGKHELATQGTNVAWARIP